MNISDSINGSEAEDMKSVISAIISTIISAMISAIISAIISTIISAIVSMTSLSEPVLPQTLGAV